MKQKIAIIGMAGRFPGSSDINALLNNLKKGKKSSAIIKKDRLKSCGLPFGANYFQGAFLEEIDKFDYKFFNILKKEANSMCPSQRMILETVYEAVENAAYSHEQLKGSRTAVFVTQGYNEYFKFFKKRSPLLSSGGMNPFVFSRITNFFDWRGMATMINTDCSSGLVAIHSACKELINKDAEYAVVCGSFLYLFPFKERHEFNDDIISQKGISCSFSEQANGMTRSEAVVALLLKPLNEALKDGDLIHSVIESTSVNNNASQGSGLTEPNARAQAENLKTVMRKANVSSKEIGYVEAHGSGTKLGDSIEVDGFNIAFKDLENGHKIQLSSVKANIGHSMTCAGLTGLIRAILSVKNSCIFPTASYETPSKVIDFKTSKVEISQQLKKWPLKHKKRIAVVSSIGISGVNAHAVISEAPKQKETTTKNKFNLVTCSAKSGESLKVWLAGLDNALDDKKNSLSDISYTLNCGRAHHDYRYATIVSSKKELKKAVKKIEKNNELIKKINTPPKVIFLFSEYSSIPKVITDFFIKKYQIFNNAYSEVKKEKINNDIRYLNFIYQYSYFHLLSKMGIKCKNFLGVGIGDLISDILREGLPMKEAVDRISKYNLKKIDNIDQRIEQLIKKETSNNDVIFVTVGHCNGIISKLKKLSAKNKKVLVLHYNMKPKEDIDQMLLLVKVLYLRGADIDWSLFGKVSVGKRIDLPTYKFDGVSCWPEERETKMMNSGKDKLDTKKDKCVTGEVDEKYFNIVHKEIVQIWKEVLKIESFDLRKSFFEEGGDSLLATVLVKKINKQFNIKLDFEDIYSHSVFPSFYDYVKSKINELENGDNILNLIINIWKKVLLLDDVSKDSNFFELGGHSLLATQIINRIKNIYNVSFNFEDIFKNPTPYLISKIVTQRVKLLNKNNNFSNFLIPIKSKPHYELSSAQKRLWILYKFEPESVFYSVNIIKTLKGNLDVNILGKAINKIVERHEIFRTNFHETSTGPVQVVKLIRKIKINFFDITNVNDQEKQEIYEKKIIKQKTLTPFKLENDRLLRVFLFKKKDDQYTLLIIIHHIIIDAWSMDIFYSELVEIYNAYLKNKKIKLPNLPIQYRDYAEWEQSKKHQVELKNQEKYWLNKFSDKLIDLDLPTDFSRPPVQTYNGSVEKIILDKEIVNNIYILGQKTDATIFVLLMTIINIFLCKITSQNDIVIGTPSSERDHKEIESLIGFFVNTLVMRSSVVGEDTFLELLSQVKKDFFNIFNNKNYPFEKLVDMLNLEKDMSRTPLFNVMFAVDKTAKGVRNFKNTTIKPSPSVVNTTEFDLFIRFVETRKNNIVLFCKYNTDLFKQSTIQNFLKIIQILIKDIIKNPNKKIKELEIVNKEEKNKLLYEFNNTQVNYPKNKTIHQLFEEQVKKTPDSIALEFKEKTLTYKELNEKANQFAHCLISKKRNKTKLVIGIIMDPSFDMLVVIISILKSGGAYLPINPDTPEQRIVSMLKTAKIKKIVIQKKYNNKINYKKLKITTITADDYFLYEDNKKNNLNVPCSLNSLAYVMFTSGSTGKPKGVEYKHQGLLNIIQWQTKDLRYNLKQTVLFYANFSFDISLQEIFYTLVTGNKLVVIKKEDKKNPDKLFQIIKKHKVSKLFLPPIMLNVLAESKNNFLKNVNDVMVCGEKLRITKDIRKLFINNLGCRLWNHYGPIETHVATRYLLLKNPRQWKENPSIGTPVSNDQIYILNQNQQLCPIGIPGELYISGDGLARGYINDKKKTNEVFLPHPFIKGKRIYKTGDLAKMHDDGNIEILGRADHQIKIRGNRVESGEIEVNIKKYGDIKEVVVIAKEKKKDNDKYLIAYYITASKQKIKTQKLKEHLKKILPDYMMPAYFVHLKEFPLNQNGKLDRLNLPTLTEKDLDKSKYQAPQTETEKKIVGIWQEVLNIKKIGIYDNFFNLGGHSLKAIQVLSRINQQFKVDLGLRIIFEYTTLQDLALKVIKEQKKKNKLLPVIIKKAPRKQYYKLSHAERRMFVLYKLEPDSHFYNMFHVKELTGKLDISKLEKALNIIVTRHESFRTNFLEVNGEPARTINKQKDLGINIYDFSKEGKANNNQKKQEIDRIIKKNTQTPFKLETEPLFRVVIIKTKEDKGKAQNNQYTLIITMHHIISDAWSMGLFHHELSMIYNALLADKKASLQKLKLQYKDYAEWEQLKEHEKRLKKQESFWLNKFRGKLPVLNLPLDKVRPAIQTYNGGTKSTIFNRNTTKKIDKLSKESNTTLFTLLFTIYNIFLHRITDQNDLIVGIPSTDRNYQELENNIGLFINTLAIRSKINEEESFIESLARIKDNFLEVFNNKDYPFEQLVEKLNPERDMSRNPLFSTLFQIFQLNDQRSRVEKSTLGDTSFKFKSDIQNTTKLDISLRAVETSNNEIILNCEYNTDLFKEKTIERFLHIIKVLTKNIIKNPNQSISNLEIITKEEKNKLLKEFNNTKVDYLKNKTVHQLFEDQVKRTPNKVALELEDDKLTYKELNEKANQLAHYLRKEKKVKPDDVIGIMLDRSFEMIIGILGILKAGGAYLPLSTNYPKERIVYVLDSSKAKILLTEKKFKNVISLKKNKKITVINIKDRKIIQEHNTDLKNSNKAKDLVYLIYTSGSTGKPKGVMIEHRNVVNFVTSIQQDIKLKKQRKILFTNDISFDMSVFETLLPLVLGISIFIQKDNKNHDLIGNLLSKYNIGVLKTTPSKMQLICSQTGSQENLKNVKNIILGGERLSEDILRKVKEVSKAKIYNMYGPTETTVYSAFGELTKTDEIELSKLVNNTQTYILNKNQQLCPVGIPGELYISGDGLARGYINDKEKTDKVFLPHPFIKGKRIYKTGDFAKMYDGGNIKILGRVDYQIKIRGYRIEPGEIESNLRNIKGINDVVVIAKESELDKNKYLVAYYTTNSKTKQNKKQLKTKDIKTELKKTLPEYMIPVVFIHLKQFPLNQNSKLDRKQLPEPSEKDLDKNKYKKPSTVIELKVAKIWQEVLAIKKIGLNDNFFNLGGHSLKAIQVLSRINKNFKVDFSLKELFLHDRLKELSEAIESELQKNRQKNIISDSVGGEPITEIGEFFEINNDVVKIKELPIIKCGNIQIELLKNTVEDVQEIFKSYKIIFENLIKNSTSLKNNIKKNVIIIGLLRREDDYSLNVKYSKKDIDLVDLREMLMKLQYIYNLKLINYDYKFLETKNFKQKMYIPKIKNEGTYGCTYPSIYAKLKWLNPDIVYYRSLIPALETKCVPKMFTTGDDEITDRVPERVKLGYENIFKTFKIDIREESLSTTKNAKKYFREKEKLQEPMLLKGSAYHLYYSRFYHDDKYKESHDGIPVLFFAGFKKDVIAHSAHLNFFGKVKNNDFWKYWKNEKRSNTINNTYKYLEIKNVTKIVPHSHKLLRKALDRTVNEYFENRIIKNTDGLSFDLYIGRQVFNLYEQRIERSIEKKVTSSDIVLLDLIKRIERPLIFLRDLLVDLSQENKDFKKFFVKVEYIVREWEVLFYDMSMIVQKQNVFYEARVSTLPNKTLCKLKLFNIKQKKYLLKEIKKMHFLHNKLMLALKKQIDKK